MQSLHINKKISFYIKDYFMSQSALDFGIERGINGMNRAVSHANRVVDKWSDIARNAVINFLKSKDDDYLFIIEDVRSEIDNKIPPPPDLRSWGSVTQSLVRHHDIEATDLFRKAASSNGSPKPVYKKGKGLNDE